MSELNALWSLWKDHPPLQIPSTYYTLIGFSLAALRSNFIIGELGIMLDAGLSTNYSPDYIFVTHTHADHCANLPYDLYNQNPEQKKTQIYVPQQSKEKFFQLIESSYQLSFKENLEQGHSLNHYDLIGVEDQQIIPIIIKNKKFNLEIVECDHGVPCVGFGLIEIRSKLKDEYVNLPGREISALKKSGQVITKEVELPFFIYLGDTSKEILKNQTLEKYKNIMIECTFILDDEIDQAEKTKHIHWNSLEPYIISHPQTNFILYHFSQRYKKSEIQKFFENRKLDNVIPWIS